MAIKLEAKVRQNSALMHFEEMGDPNMSLSKIMSVSSVTSDYAAFSANDHFKTTATPMIVSPSKLAMSAVNPLITCARSRGDASLPINIVVD